MEQWWKYTRSKDATWIADGRTKGVGNWKRQISTSECLSKVSTQIDYTILQPTMRALSAGEADTRSPSSGHQANDIIGLWPGHDKIWTQLVDGRVAKDCGSTCQTRTQLWHATAKTEDDMGLNKEYHRTWFTLVDQNSQFNERYSVYTVIEFKSQKLSNLTKYLLKPSRLLHLTTNTCNVVTRWYQKIVRANYILQGVQQITLLSQTTMKNVCNNRTAYQKQNSITELHLYDKQ